MSNIISVIAINNICFCKIYFHLTFLRGYCRTPQNRGAYNAGLGSHLIVIQKAKRKSITVFGLVCEGKLRCLGIVSGDLMEKKEKKKKDWVKNKQTEKQAKIGTGGDQVPIKGFFFYSVFDFLGSSEFKHLCSYSELIGL